MWGGVTVLLLCEYEGEDGAGSQTADERAAAALKQSYWMHLIVFWGALILAIVAASFAIGAFAYGVDPNKNIGGPSNSGGGSGMLLGFL